MNKKSILWILLDLIFIIVFNTVFFVAGGFNHPASVWLSYAFIHFAYIMVIITPLLIRKSSSSAVFGFSIYSISSTYFLFEFVVGLLFILFKSETVKFPLIVQIIIAGIYAVILISHLIANESTADSVERREAEASYIKTAALRVKSLIGKLDDKKANRELERAYDALHSSPTRTASIVHSLEVEIKNAITELESAVATKDKDRAITVAAEIVALTDERNRKLRLTN